MKTLAEMQARLEEIKMELNTVNDANALNALGEEFDRLENDMKALEKKEEMLAKLSGSTGRKAPNAAPEAKVVVGDHQSKKDIKKGGFASQGEFLMKVRDAKRGSIDERLKAGMMERNGEDGGFMVPDDFRTEIERKLASEESLLSKVRNLTTDKNTLHIPTIESAVYDQTGVIQAFWEAERQPHKYTQGAVQSETIKLHKLTAAVRVTEELLDDSVGLESYINTMAPEALTYKVNSALLSGTGVGMPLGILNAPSGIVIAKEGGQAAGTINFLNVSNMMSHFNPASYARAEWLVNPAAMPELRKMTYADGSPAFAPVGGASETPYGTLFGRPIRPMMAGLRELGVRGDIILVDWQQYVVVQKAGGVKASSSVHVFWDTDEVAYKYQLRIGGQPLFKAPTKSEFGGFLTSGIVTLADRA